MRGREVAEIFDRIPDEPSKDRNGVERWTFPEVGRSVKGCSYADGSSDEPLSVGRNATISDGLLLAPAGTVIDEYARVKIRGRLFEVDGTVQDWRSRTIRRGAGVVVNLKEVKG